MTDRVIETVQRLAETQQNLSVPMTEQERLDLREAARRLRELNDWEGKLVQDIIMNRDGLHSKLKRALGLT
jgi:hypothetical protein